MRAERGASQILFGLLPRQTADLEGRIWRVTKWEDPISLGVDEETVRRALLAAIGPWVQSGRDGGLAEDLRKHAPVEVVSVNPDRGVVVEPFPEQWRCRACGRLEDRRLPKCKCGSQSIAQMQFVAYHLCGAAREPLVPKCNAHHAVAVRLPGTATARELRFFCPECKRKLSDGFPYQPCKCGDKVSMSVTVHRAAVVYSPRFTVLVNPPDPALAARFRAGGGGARALEWVLDGMKGQDPTTSKQTVAGLIDTLRQQGLSEETARELAEQAASRGEIDSGETAVDLGFPAASRDGAQEEATSMAAAASGGRLTLGELVDGTTPPLRTLYELAYRRAIPAAGLEDVDLLQNFPVVTLAFGFTRGEMQPGAARLVPYREKGGIRAYGLLSRTEALLFRLDPLRVHRFLTAKGVPLDGALSSRDARVAILRKVTIPSPFDDLQEEPTAGERLLRLVHSYAHRVVRRLAAFAGIERDGLAEYLLPHHLAFIVYAASRGDFVLGGLQAVFEQSLDRFLDDLKAGESRCPLDPGCRNGGGACMACLHLGEPSCRWFNRFLDRSVLFGPTGYLSQRVSS